MKLPQTESKGWVVKGRRDWDDLLRIRTKKPAGSAVQWAREAVANVGCQEELDAKGFTGRGSLRELRHMVTELSAVEGRMEGLSAASKALSGVRLYLVVHRHKKTGYTFLRWRERSGGARHVPWHELEALLAGHAPAQRRWCTEASDAASGLNAEHLALRERIKAVRLLQPQPAIYARPIPGKPVEAG